jgi:hypothetical protein
LLYKLMHDNIANTNQFCPDDAPFEIFPGTLQETKDAEVVVFTLTYVRRRWINSVGNMAAAIRKFSVKGNRITVLMIGSTDITKCLEYVDACPKWKNDSETEKRVLRILDAWADENKEKLDAFRKMDTNTIMTPWPLALARAYTFKSLITDASLRRCSVRAGADGSLCVRIPRFLNSSSEHYEEAKDAALADHPEFPINFSGAMGIEHYTLWRTELVPAGYLFTHGIDATLERLNPPCLFEN